MTPIGKELISFMNVYPWYNQIKIWKDEEIQTHYGPRYILLYCNAFPQEKKLMWHIVKKSRSGESKSPQNSEERKWIKLLLNQIP